MKRQESFRRVALAAALLCLVYLAWQALYIPRLPLVMDEFQGARAVHQIGERLPYRDFRPYKTVLGYYLQLPALRAAGGTWDGLMAVKLEMALINTAVLFAAALALARRYRGRAVLLGLLLLVLMSTFLERSSELRVDMLTAICGLAGLLLLLDRRYAWAGFAVGLSFLVSQKGVYYVAASGAGLFAGWAADRFRLRALRPGISFAAAAAGTLVAYLGFWSLLSSTRAVIDATFLSHGAIAFGRLYDIRLQYWGQTLLRNPLFYLLTVAAFWLIEQRRQERGLGEADRTLLFYGLTLAAFGAWHRQPWPYFFVLLIPTFFVLVVRALDGLLELREQGRLWRPRLLLAAMVVLGVFYPLTRLPVNLARDSGLQRHMIELAERVLEPGDTYLAGVDMLYRRSQALPSLAWLDRARLMALHQAGGEEVTEIREQLVAAPPKLVLYNYRIGNLPGELRLELTRNYSRAWGNLLLYAPLVEEPASELRLAFGGRYVIDAPGDGDFRIDGRAVARGETAALDKGPHRVAGPPPFRLQLVPAGLEELFDARYREARPLFPSVYEY